MWCGASGTRLESRTKALKTEGLDPGLFGFQLMLNNGEITMGIGDAINEIRSGRKVQRNGWNEPGQYLMLQRPDSNSKMTLPYIFIHTVQGNLIPWLASQTDILARDWQVVD